MNAIAIGLDIGKSVFQVHGEDVEGKIVLQKRLRRLQVEAFFTSCRPRASGPKPAARRTIGAARCGRWATTCG